MSTVGAPPRRRCSGPAPAVRIAGRRLAVPPLALALLAPAVVAGLLLWLAFEAGGFFPDTVAIAAIAAGGALAAWLALVWRPLAAATVPLAVAVAGLALLAAWMFASQAWSDAPARALTEADRALLYAAVAALAGLAGGVAVLRRAAPRAVAAALALACAAGLVTRVLPDLWSVPRDVDFDRLSYPLTYWNGQGLLAALGIVACVHLACDLREPRAVRALAAAAIPVVATSLLFTFSRGAILVAPIGVLAYLVLARPRGAASALVAIAPTTAVAVTVAYRADAVASARTAAAVPGGEARAVALVVVACAVAAALAIAALGPLDRRAARWRAPRISRRRRAALLAAALAAVVIAGVAAGAPGRIAAQTDRLSHSTHEVATSDPRSRLSSLADSGRVDQWNVALDAFDAEPLHGAGAGTYPLLWTEHRPSRQEVTDGHSLYLEVLAELGVVGLVLLLAALGGLLAGAVRCLRHGERPLGAVAAALLLTWALHAGIDWDWELPGLTVPVLVLAAVAAGRPRAPASAPVRLRGGGLAGGLAAIGVLAVLVAPLAVARSQAPLDRALAALDAGRCDEAIAEARRSTDALSWRPEPLQVVAICEARAGHGDVALASMQAAVDRDPGNWRLLYGLGVMRAVEGLDPRPALAEARRRNPRSRLVRDAVRRFDTDSSEAWRKRAYTVPLPL